MPRPVTEVVALLKARGYDAERYGRYVVCRTRAGAWQRPPIVFPAPDDWLSVPVYIKLLETCEADEPSE